MPHSRRVTLFVLLGSAGLTAAACGQSPPDYGFDWVTIGDAGNRATIPSEVPLQPWLTVGAVSYTYRMTKTKLSVAQYSEFVNAYAPFWQGSPTDWVLMGDFLDAIQQPDGTWTYPPLPGYDAFGARIHWQMAARYCNWLQNGKALNSAAFETGVYDTSTFHFDGANWSAQLTPSPGANYWIPSFDEWVKAAHYDPNRYGAGQGGYWISPNQSNDALVMGLPSDGGQTIGDLLWQHIPLPDLGAWPLGQYPQVQSHYGLIDVSATVPDYTSTISGPGPYVCGGGSLAGTSSYYAFDRLDSPNRQDLFDGALADLRMAGTIPCYPNCDGSTGVPVLNVGDFVCFFQRFMGGDMRANCDGSSTAPVLNVQDFTCFLQKFAQGCPAQ